MKKLEGVCSDLAVAGLTGLMAILPVSQVSCTKQPEKAVSIQNISAGFEDKVYADLVNLVKDKSKAERTYMSDNHSMSFSIRKIDKVPRAIGKFQPLADKSSLGIAYEEKGTFREITVWEGNRICIYTQDDNGWTGSYTEYSEKPSRIEKALRGLSSPTVYDDFRRLNYGKVDKNDPKLNRLLKLAETLIKNPDK